MLGLSQVSIWASLAGGAAAWLATLVTRNDDAIVTRDGDTINAR